MSRRRAYSGASRKSTATRTAITWCSLYKCRECGQLYFYEWYEWVDWKEGNDKQYTTLVPAHTAEDVEALKATSPFTLMYYFPRLHLDGAPEWKKWKE